MTNGEHDQQNSTLATQSVSSPEEIVQYQEYPIQPLDTAVRGFIRGALPPQGLEPFIRELRTTIEDVTGMYTRIFGDLLGIRNILQEQRSNTSEPPDR